MRDSVARIGIMVLTVLAVYAGGKAHIAPVQARTAIAAPATLPGYLVVTKRFGAALRLSPSSNASIVRVMRCGTQLAVSGANQGWYHVYVGPYEGWVGGARVANAANPPRYSCAGAYTFQMGQHAYSFVKTGCLSLRLQPSRQAAFNTCVNNYHDYTVTNGPIEIAGEDWFGVTSPTTGSGWSLAQYLFPYRNN